MTQATPASPSRVLHVIHGMRRGGLETGVLNLAHGLPRAEFTQGICCLAERGELADRLPKDVPLWVLDRGKHDTGLWFRLARVLKQWRPHVIHCRNWNAWLDTLIAYWLTGRRGALVWSFHGFTSAARPPWRRRVASRVLARFTPHLMAVCQDSAQRYGHDAGIDPRRFSILYNGVNLDRFQPGSNRPVLRQELGLPADALLVITVASLVPIKDHAGLLQGLANVKAQLPANAYFLWLGEGEEQARLMALRDTLGLAERVQLLGNSDQVPRFLGAADLFVLPSLLEGMSNAIIEAMASGLPVVARAVGGNIELVVDGETGRLVPSQDPQALGTAIVELLTQPEQCYAMGQRARAHAAEKFGLDAMMANYATFYRRLGQ